MEAVPVLLDVAGPRCSRRFRHSDAPAVLVKAEREPGYDFIRLACTLSVPYSCG